MKRFADYIKESNLTDSQAKSFYSEIPPNKQRQITDIAADLFREIFPKYTKECIEFLETFKYKNESIKSEIDNLKYELKLSEKDPKHDGLGYAYTKT